MGSSFMINEWIKSDATSFSSVIILGRSLSVRAMIECVAERGCLKSYDIVGFSLGCVSAEANCGYSW